MYLRNRDNAGERAVKSRWRRRGRAPCGPGKGGS